MTTRRALAGTAGRRWPVVRALAIGAPVALAVWFATSLAVTLAQPPGLPVAVMSAGGIDSALAAVLAAGGHLVQVTGTSVIAISDDPAFVRKLYASGALIVVGARPDGCIVVPGSA